MLVDRLVGHAVPAEEALHNVQLDQCRGYQKYDLYYARPLDAALRLLQDCSVYFIPLNMELLISANLLQARSCFMQGSQSEMQVLLLDDVLDGVGFGVEVKRYGFLFVIRSGEADRGYGLLELERVREIIAILLAQHELLMVKCFHLYVLVVFSRNHVADHIGVVATEFQACGVLRHQFEHDGACLRNQSCHDY